MFGISKYLGIDLGTANTVVYAKNKGIVVNEPSVVAIDEAQKRVLAVGDEAKQMVGRTPGCITAKRPLKDGVIADFHITEAMLKYFIDKATTKGMFKGKIKVVVGIPAGVTEVEKRAVIEAAQRAGAKEAQLIEEPMAAAIGAGLPVADPRGSMVVDMGGGTTEVAVISLGGIVTAKSLRVAGDELDEAIIYYVKREYSLMIGERTAEEIKMTIGSAYKADKEKSLQIRGRDLITGLPKLITITSTEVMEAIKEPVNSIIDAIKYTLEKTPPELAADIMETGITLTGGGALLEGLDKLIRQETDMPVTIADEPLNCVAIGTGRALEDYDKLSNRVLISINKLR